MPLITQAKDVPADRYNAISSAVQVGRDHVPFSVRQRAVFAAEQVLTDWDENREKWTAFYDEIERLRGLLLANGIHPFVDEKD